MLYLTGDTHRNFFRIVHFCERFHTTKDDLMIVLGDAMVNYWGGYSDQFLKEHLESLPITFMFVRGNHERRPNSFCEIRPTFGGTYQNHWSGRFLVEPDYPSLLYAIDGEYYSLAMHSSLVLGGAYSVDKHLRLADPNAYGLWFSDEQLTLLERDAIYSQLSHYTHRDMAPNLILSHTCPHQYIPREKFLGMVDQSTVDDSMERWLDQVNDLLPKENLRWYCGHWHTNKTIDHMHFLYEDIIMLEPKI